MPKALTITRTAGAPGSVYYPLSLASTPQPPTPPASPTQLVLKILTVALNHRDLFIRQHLYPGTTFSPVPLLSDGCGLVISTGSSPSAQQWQGKRVVINPGEGWKDSPEGPEEEGGYRILG